MNLQKNARSLLTVALVTSITVPGQAQVRLIGGVAASAVSRMAPRSGPISAPPIALAPSNPDTTLPAVFSLSQRWAPTAAAKPTGANAAVLKAERSLSIDSQAHNSQPASFAAERWDAFWTGADLRSGDVAVRALASPARLAAAAAGLVPAAHGLHVAVAQVAPYAEGAAVLAGAVASQRGVHWLIGKIAAAKKWERHQIAAIRFMSTIVVWTGAAAMGLYVAGASVDTVSTALGGGGLLLTLALKDVLGNLLQGLNFLLSKPVAIGTRVEIDADTGRLSDITATGIELTQDDGLRAKIRHAPLSAKVITVYGQYKYPSVGLTIPHASRLRGVSGVAWRAVDRRFILAVGVLGALLFLPSFVGIFSTGWAATSIHYATVAATLWFTYRLDSLAGAVISGLAERNNWSAETRAFVRIAVSAAVWLGGVGVALRAIGLSWSTLGASMGVTTIGIGLASNNIFSTVVHGAGVLLSNTFKVGDHVKIGTFEGDVEDLTLNHVVIKLDEEKHALIPHAVVRDALLVVKTGNPK